MSGRTGVSLGKSCTPISSTEGTLVAEDKTLKERGKGNNFKTERYAVRLPIMNEILARFYAQRPA